MSINVNELNASILKLAGQTFDSSCLSGWIELTEGFDLNEAFGRYRTASSAIVNSLDNKPNDVHTGEVTVEWFPSTSANLYGTQILKHTYSTSPSIWYRTLQNTTWTGWTRITDSAVLSEKLAGYLPLTGGTISNFLSVYNDSAKSTYIDVKNTLRRVYMEVDGAGSFNLYDSTNSNSIIASTADGTTKFYGTATGNLPLTGGTVTGYVTIKDDGMVPLTVDNIATDTNVSMIGFANNGSTYGYLGYDTEGEAIVHSSTYSVKKILHLGNYKSYVPTLTGTGASGTWGISITGNAATATSATTATTASKSNCLQRQTHITTTDDLDAFLDTSGAKYTTFKFESDNGMGFGSNDGMVLSLPWTNTDYGAQIAFDDYTAGNVAIRGKATNWGSWYKLLHSGNYTSYVPTLTGGGASGTWGINISGKATSLNYVGGSSSASSSDLYWYVYTWTISAAYGGCAATYSVIDRENSFNGILSIRFRNSDSATEINFCNVKWLSATKTPPEACITYVINDDSITYNLYIKYHSTWCTPTMAKIHEVGTAGEYVGTKVTEMTGTISGSSSVVKVDALNTPRTIQTNLGSTSSAYFDGSANVTPGVTGTLSVANGGTGVTSFISGYALIGNGTGAVTTRAITNMVSQNFINYNTNLMTTNTLAYWNGAYNSSGGSNLLYCNKGAFGTAVTYNATSSITSGSSALITSGAVYTGLAGKSDTGHTHTTLEYSSAVTTDDAIDGFLEANTLKTAIWTSTSTPGTSNGIIISGGYNSTSYGFQLAIDDDPTYIMSLRQKGTGGWSPWKRIPMGDGTGASGTWAIGISGNAATATTLSGLTTTVGELNYVDGVTSNIQTQLNGKLKGSYSSAVTAATAGWYRIATSVSGISNCTGIFQIASSLSGYHTTATITAATNYGTNDSSIINVLQCSHYGGKGLTKSRIVYHTTYTGNYAYLEVYMPNAGATTLYVHMVGGHGWSLVAPNTAGSIPSGYSSKEVTLSNDTITATTFAGSLSGNATTATTANALTTDTSCKLYAGWSNEVNFGGTNASDTIYFGYRAIDSKPIPNNFVFGGSTATATVKAASFVEGGTALSSKYAAASHTHDYAPSSHTHSYLPLSGGTLTGNVTLTTTKNFILRENSSYQSGIGYDTSGNECIALWAKNTVTRLRWHAGVDMTSMAAGTMMGITPDFEVSKASGTATGYIAGNTIVHSGNIGTYALPKSGGSVSANTNYTTNQVRNTVFTTTDPGAGVSTTHANGSIIAVYE